MAFSPIYQGSLGASVGVGVGLGLAERLLGRFTQPFDSYFGAKDAIANYMASLDAWNDNPVLLPSLDTLLEIENRGWAQEAAERRALYGAIRNHGVYQLSEGPGLNAPQRQAAALWRMAQNMKRAVSGPEAILAAFSRGYLEQGRARELMDRAGGNWENLLETFQLQFARPGVPEVIRAWITNQLGAADPDVLMKEAGSRWRFWSEILPIFYETPSVGELMLARNRGFLDDAQYRGWIERKGYRHEGMVDLFDKLRQGIPGVSDLLRMISRQLFSPEIVGDYGLYQGYDNRADRYFGQLGLNYPLGFNVPTERGMEECTLPRLYWAMTREILSLGQAYQAYQRLRPDQIRRWQNEIPTLRPFTIDDLRFHLRVAGYPPPMQDYQIALSHPPIGVRAIAQAAQFLDPGRAWIFNRYLDLGFREDDAALQADLQEARKAFQATAVERSIAQSVQKQTIGMIEGLYEDGILDREGARGQLADAGFGGPLATQIIDLVDFRVERALIKGAVAAVRRDYLSGELSLPEAQNQLGRIGIAGPRQQNYLAAWTIQRTGRRRRLETSKILSLTGKGMLSYDEAYRRLGNLGWDQPDAVLLLAEAEASLRDREQRAAKASERDAKARARELERLAKQADAQAAKLRADANRVAPRGVLYKWLQEAIISEDQFRDMMRQRGYPDDLIEDYIRQSKWQKPRVEPAPGGTGVAAGSKRASQAMLVSWWRDAIITDEQLDAGLEALGYGAEDRERIREEAEIAGPRGKRHKIPPGPPAEEEAE